MLEEVSIEIIFPAKQVEGFHEAGIFDGIMKKMKLNELKDYFKDFKGYRIDSIELYVEGVAKDGDLTRLLISFEGKGGCKIILKPKE